jgi:hypothetical protein
MGHRYLISSSLRMCVTVSAKNSTAGMTLS